jgi:hypothetical protein
MPIRKELNVRLPNSPGSLAGVCRILSLERVNIAAMMLEPSGHLRLVVDNHVRALGALRDQHHTVTERDVITVTVANGPGGVMSALQLLADAGRNLDYAYVGAADGTATALAVLGTEDAQRAAVAAGL